MKKLLFLTGVWIVFFFQVLGQTRSDLEKQRNTALADINYVDEMLRSTEKQKTESLNQLKIIGNKLTLRENVISGLREEINLVNYRNDLNRIAIEMMEADLVRLKDDYAKSVINAYKLRNGMPLLAYVFSARDFNQAYKRIKYLQQVAKFRREEAQIIQELKGQIEISKVKLEEDLAQMTDLRSKEEQQKDLLKDDQEEKKKLLTTLGKKETQLRKELETKRQLAKKIESEINRLIEQERKKASGTAPTAEAKVLGDNFADNKGKLPWPVDKGIVTSQFGIHKHAVLSYVTEDNFGIEITCVGETQVKSVFKGQVASVSGIPGGNMAVLLRHGQYFTVYLNVVDVVVKTGDQVEASQVLGKVYVDKEDGNKAILKFFIWQDKSKEDPELWLEKKR